MFAIIIIIVCLFAIPWFMEKGKLNSTQIHANKYPAFFDSVYFARFSSFLDQNENLLILSLLGKSFTF